MGVAATPHDFHVTAPRGYVRARVMASVLAKVRGSVLRRKRKRRYADAEEGQGKKRRRKGSASLAEDGLEEGRIAAFVEWCQNVGIRLHPKVRKCECVWLLDVNHEVTEEVYGHCSESHSFIDRRSS